MLIKKLFFSCISVLFPSVCLSCRRHLVPYPFLLCSSCREAILKAATPSSASLSSLRQIWSCGIYEGPLKVCIKNFKYQGRINLLKEFEELVHDFSRKNNVSPDEFDLIVPVPLHPAKRFRRGYNQSELISKVLSKEFSRPVFSRALLKTKNTLPQTGLSKKMRKQNLKNSFVACDKARLSGKSILLVDDIMTTGTTLEACAKELKRAGAKRVSGFTLARAT